MCPPNYGQDARRQFGILANGSEEVANRIIAIPGKEDGKSDHPSPHIGTSGLSPGLGSLRVEIEDVVHDLICDTEGRRRAEALLRMPDVITAQARTNV